MNLNTMGIYTDQEYLSARRAGWGMATGMGTIAGSNMA